MNMTEAIKTLDEVETAIIAHVYKGNNDMWLVVANITKVFPEVDMFHVLGSIFVMSQRGILTVNGQKLELVQ